MKLATRLSSLRRCEAGAAAIEFALVAMVAIPLFFGIFEFGRALYMRNEMSFAADRAARKILISPAATISDLTKEIRDAVVDTRWLDTYPPEFGNECAYGDGRLPSSLSGPDCVNDGGTNFRTVLLTRPLTLLIPGLSESGITLTISRRVPDL